MNQKKWLDYMRDLEFSNFESKKFGDDFIFNVPVNIGYGEIYVPKKEDLVFLATLEYSKKEDYRNFSKVEHTVIPHNCLVLEFDGLARNESLAETGKLLHLLHVLKFDLGFDLFANYWITDHYGRSPHIYLFVEDLKRKDFISNVVAFLFPNIDRNLLFAKPNRKTVRAIGASYNKNQPVTFKSYFKCLKEIKPVYKFEDVNYPNENNKTANRGDTS